MVWLRGRFSLWIQERHPEVSGRVQRREKVDGTWPATGPRQGYLWQRGKITAKKEQNTVREAGARELEGDTARTAWL